ncbi:Piwi domain-containing protein [Fimicolochytrium jonesii]|uniref:Piwi domain-containing protein n=1 Tax=Fimicolochytrium jonesii TaxID=1396493 RepID=UPI0022FEFDDD|nr:Piwi domain-containing protein [Fimicolochytrium jonesii]KAI8822400.1 Piwi domain-containing protein [Fimicolochytrium jonesii]
MAHDSPIQLTDLPLRPTPGVDGRNIKIRCNIYPLRMAAETMAYQYDVTMVPDVTALAKRAWRLAQPLFLQNDERAYIAYDGKKNAFSTVDFQTTTVTVTIDKDEDDYYPNSILPPPVRGERNSRSGGRAGRGGRESRGGFGGRRSDRGSADPYDGPVSAGPVSSKGWAPQSYAIEQAPESTEPRKPKTEEVTITLKQVAKIDFHSLMLFMSRQGAEDDTALHATTALSTVLRHVPGMTFVTAGANFYSPEDRTHIAGGLEIWRGYHQSIRVMMAGHLGVNVDVAATVFRQGEVTLLELLKNALKCRDFDEMADKIREMGTPAVRQRLTSDFKGANVVTTHRSDMKQRFNIGSISRDTADTYMFDVNGVKMSVTEYFFSQYRITLNYPYLPLALKANGKSAFPLEFLKMTPSQRFKKKLNGEQTADMIRATVQRPIDREKKIASAVNGTLKYQNNDHLRSFGLAVEPQPMTIPARILTAPNVVFGNNQLFKGGEGFWKLGKQLAKPSKISSYAFAFFVNIDQREALTIRNQLLDGFQNTGILFASLDDSPLRIQNPDDSQNVRRCLHSLAREAKQIYDYRCQIIFCIAPRGLRTDNGLRVLYEEIKRITLTEMDVLSQCLDYNKTKLDRLNPKYSENVALKVNVKMGGATNFVDKLPLMDKPTLICGADVTHAHAGSAAPSVAAVVTSTDRSATKYRTFLSAQASRVEIIQDMERIMGEAIDAFASSQKTFPARVIFFRDGVSSGQFKEVRETEIAAIKRVFAKRKLNGTQLTFVIVQKRHHIRLFPNDNNQDKSGNCLPGTTVDTVITHPSEFNFILQSHAGLQGTSRPTLYHVIYDDMDMGSDQLQQLCYNLCFLSERANRSINMVAPAYRAHLAAYYGRMFLEGDFGSDAASALSGASQELPVALRKVASTMDQHTMYYM